MSKSVNWGFMGTAKISKINAPAAVSANSCIVAVAGRDATRVEEWLDDMMPELTAAAAHEKLALPKRPLSFTGYDALLSADAAATAPSASSGTTAGGAASDSALRVSSIQAVYIPIPTAKDVEWVIASARAGKHVLCDKPTAPTFEELDAMLSACASSKVQFMDGVMFMHHERLARLSEYVHGGKPLTDEPVLAGDTAIGRVRRVHCECHLQADASFFGDNIRVHKDCEPLGAVGDLGWYCIRMTLWTYNWELPTRVCALAHERTEEGVPLSASAILTFSEGRGASFSCSFNEFRRQDVRITGSAGSVSFSDLINNSRGDATDFVVCQTLPDSDKGGARIAEERRIPLANTYQEAAMFRRFNSIVTSGQLEAEWPFYSMCTQAVVDAVMRSLHAGGAPQEIPDSVRARIAAAAPTHKHGWKMHMPALGKSK